MKNNRGITLLSLTIYIIAIIIVMSILASIRNYFSSHQNVIKESARYAASFDKFNAYFVDDIKQSNDVAITQNNNDITIVLENGATYKYVKNDRAIYRGNIKIANSVTGFVVGNNAELAAKKVVINSVTKKIIRIHMITGDSANNMFDKTIDYTLKYW